jgi:hypothetical protein
MRLNRNQRNVGFGRDRRAVFEIAGGAVALHIDRTVFDGLSIDIESAVGTKIYNHHVCAAEAILEGRFLEHGM